MACRFCQVNVFGSSHTWDFHHTDPRVFLSSAQSGCVLCRRLARDAGGPDGISRLFSARDPGKAIYRWSIKKAAKIRESQQYVTITFRPLPGVTDLGEVDFVMLPEKGQTYFHEPHMPAYPISRFRSPPNTMGP
jgi:hypothetical protein